MNSDAAAAAIEQSDVAGSISDAGLIVADLPRREASLVPFAKIPKAMFVSVFCMYFACMFHLWSTL